MRNYDQQAKGETFAKLHVGPDILMLPNAWDVGSAIILERAGFQAIGTTSAGIAFANGYRDGEAISRDGMMEVVSRIAGRISVPVTADLEAGYGPRPDDVAETIRQAIDAGAVGANLEDGALHGEESLAPQERAVERLRAARETADASGVKFIINARTDAFLKRPRASVEENLATAIERGNAYRTAGADCIFVPGVSDSGVIARLVREVEAPLNVLGAFSGVTAPPLPELQMLGVRRVSLGGSLALAVLAMIRRVAEEIRKDGSFAYGTSALSNKELNELLA